MNKRLIGIVGGVVVALVTILYLTIPVSEETTVPQAEEVAVEEIPEVVEPEYRFGIKVNDFELLEGQIKRNQTFADLLLPYNVSRQDIYAIDRKSKEVFSVRNFVPGRNYTVFYTNDSIKKAAYFVYEPTPLDYVVYQLKDSIAISMGEREVEVAERTMAGRIDISLDHSIRREGGSAALVSAMADLFGWQIDPRTLRKGDWFKVIYEDRLVNGESIGIGNIIGAEFNHMGSSYMSYAHDDGQGLNYYDEEGESMQKAFLRYPVEYSRISSRYNPTRFHPVLKRRTPHLGTDYAANRGTPIKAAGDGVIINKGFTNGNGNYIKIKHNGTYTTGYLHMSKFARVKQGERVKKGQIIGYVGKTGLATGNHLCFRFWKRGKQVDFLKEKLPAEKPLEGDELLKFEAVVQLMNKKLDDIPTAWAEKDINALADKP
jgi:murein DD-endopeptidase MepM/ murein hydrolase activator NlpD